MLRVSEFIEHKAECEWSGVDLYDTTHDKLSARVFVDTLILTELAGDPGPDGECRWRYYESLNV